VERLAADYELLPRRRRDVDADTIGIARPLSPLRPLDRHPARDQVLEQLVELRGLLAHEAVDFRRLRDVAIRDLEFDLHGFPIGKDRHAFNPVIRAGVRAPGRLPSSPAMSVVPPTMLRTLARDLHAAR